MINNNSFDSMVSDIVTYVTAEKRGLNTVLIYGALGVDKTHILHAIENEIKTTTTDKKVVSVTAVKFAAELVVAIERNEWSSFKDKFKGADVLIMDDLQFLQGKDAVQEAFFYMFNDRYEAGKKMIFGCNCNPLEMENISGQILNRITNGLVIELVREKRN